MPTGPVAPSLELLPIRYTHVADRRTAAGRNRGSAFRRKAVFGAPVPAPGSRESVYN